MIQLVEFQTQMERLSSRFDPKYYDPELCMLIYRECRDLDILWLRRTITGFLGLHKPALIPEFREAIRIETNRVRVENRDYIPREHTSQSMFTSGQIKFLFDLTKHIVTHKIPEQFVGLFCVELGRVIDFKDEKGANSLFKESSQELKVPYNKNIYLKPTLIPCDDDTPNGAA